MARDCRQAIGAIGRSCRHLIPKRRFDPAELEIAYVVSEQYQMNGFGKESATLLLNYMDLNNESILK
jgi:RimJ/RimL family protein N-acetyltransferase